MGYFKDREKKKDELNEKIIIADAISRVVNLQYSRDLFVGLTCKNIQSKVKEEFGRSIKVKTIWNKIDYACTKYPNLCKWDSKKHRLIVNGKTKPRHFMHELLERERKARVRKEEKALAKKVSKVKKEKKNYHRYPDRTLAGSIAKFLGECTYAVEIRQLAYILGYAEASIRRVLYHCAKYHSAVIRIESQIPGCELWQVVKGAEIRPEYFIHYNRKVCTTVQENTTCMR